MIRFHPSFIIAASFFLVIVTGGLLLSLPISSTHGTFTDLLDAMFTANSATCVTGLVTLDTGTHFSLFGLFVIMALMQVGGLGYMTFSIFMVLLFRQKMFISEKLMMKETLNINSTKDVAAVLKKIFGIVFFVEGIGAIILFLRWLPELGAGKALLWALFHSISAFNNAGFALPPNFANLSPYVGDWIINLTITTLIIIGGIGFIVITDVLQRRKWSLHTKVTILTTLFLIIGGATLIFLLERNNPATLGPLGLPYKILASYFQAVTPRTAGFHTINNGLLFPATALFTMFLMFVGASPGGTGGGIKTTTFALILATIWATVLNRKDTTMFSRRIPAQTVRRAFTIAFLALGLLSVAIFALNEFEKLPAMALAYEAFSAFGTVGLSMNITPELHAAGKLIVMCLMYLGRVGPLTFLLALVIKQREPKVEPPKEGISIG